MNGLSTLQLAVGSAGVMVLAVSAAFAGYWNLFGKKHRALSKQEIPRAVNSSMPQRRTGFLQ